MNKKTIITGSSIRYCQITKRFVHRIFWGCLLFATMLLLPIYHVLASESYAKIESASWQDSNTLVLMWADPGLYEVYRSDSPNSNYILIGTSDSGFYVDNSVTYSDNTGNANEYYYRLGSNGVPVSAPVQSGYNSHDLSCVQIFMYHHFIPDNQVGSKEYSKDFLDYAITTSEFEQDLIFLKKNGFTTITSKELLEYIDGKAKLPQKAVIISIDDGSLSVYRYAFPLLKKYDMKAEFNLIGKSIDDATEPFLNQESDVSDERTAEDYCNWYEILEMNESGLVSHTSHSYALHYYGQYGRIGALQADGEEETDYAKEMKRDYDTAYRCINGWLGTNPTTFVYPYSKRNLLSDKTLLENTGYRILMAGQISERVTKGNYFVDGAPSASYMRVMTRIPRMTGTPLSQYISDVYASDAANGVNINIDTSSVY
ncbi:MAG: polysaccharide deacetylase family protein [Christensenellaceae bacterium]|nr:polysaccharide deacetylase family protein [Christensenellaceae bacterium]